MNEMATFDSAGVAQRLEVSGDEAAGS
jgi:hypothetical protein